MQWRGRGEQSSTLACLSETPQEKPRRPEQGSATLSMAYAGALFADACLRGLNGEPNVEEFSFVQSTVVPGLPFFSSKVKLGPTGARPLISPFCTQL
jgi:malate/lactate dehydrogenase